MKKIFLGLLCAFLLSACGSKPTETETKNGEIPADSKTIANKYAVINVPNDWVVLKTPSSTPQLILMEKFPMTANLIDGDGYNSKTSKKLFSMIQNEFPNARLLEEISDKKIIFSAQKHADGDTYKFEQKITELSDDKYLLSSCSYPIDYPDSKCSEFFEAIKLR